MNRSRVTGDLASHGNIFVDTANDRVGIGSTIPAHKLEVRGDTHIYGDLEVESNLGYIRLTDSNSANDDFGLRNDNGVFFIRDVTHGANRFSINSEGTLRALNRMDFDAGIHVNGGDLEVRSDSTKLQLGASQDFEVFHDGSNSYISNTTGTLLVQNSGNVVIDHSGDFYVRSHNGNETRIRANNNGAVELYYNNTKMLETNIPSGHNGEVILGQKVHVRHTGSGNGQIFPSSGNLYLNAKQGETSVILVADAGVHLYYNNAQKFVTTDYGVNVTGTTDTDSLVVSGVTTCLAVNTGNIDATGNLSITSTAPQIFLTDTNANSDYSIVVNGGQFRIRDETNSANRLAVNSDGHTDVYGRLDAIGGLFASADSTIEGDLTLTDTTADSAAGPEFKLFRNSASPANADYLGQIKFAGESSTGVERNYAKITGKILDVTNGAEDGILEFAHIKNGSQTITGRWRSDSLQLLNGTALTVAGTSDFTGNATFTGQLNLTATSQYPLSINGSNNGKIALMGSSVPYIAFFEVSTRKAYIQWHTDGYLLLNNEESSEQLRIGSGNNGLTFLAEGSNRTVWHAGNDGSGSALDADLLDGQEGSYYRNASNLNAGTIPAARVPTLNQNTTGVSAATDALRIIDTRNDGARVPNDYAAHKVTSEFTNQIFNGWWSTLTVKGWANGYAPWQLIGKSDTTQNTNLYVRFGHGSNNTWSSSYQIWHSGNDGSGGGLDADLWDGNQFASYLNQALLTSSGPTFANVYNNGWFRNNDSGDGMYNQSTGQYFYSDDDDYWNVAGGGTANGIRFRDDHAGTIRGYVYANNSNHVGFLNQNSDWTLRTESAGITKLGSNGYQLRNGNNARNLYFYSGDSGSTTDIGISGYNGAGTWRFQLYGTGGSYGFLDGNWGGWDLKKNVNGKLYIRIDSSNTDHEVWCAGNDGSGSGLDADTLDGNQASAFPTLGGSNSFSNSYNEFGNATGSVSNNGSWNARLNLAGSQHARLDVKSVSDGIITAMYSHTGHTTGKIGTMSDHGLTLLCNSSSRAELSKAGTLTTHQQGTLWGSSNDGPGSGLDADTLDGSHGSDMIRSGAQGSVGGWHISAYRNGNGTSPHLYFSHSSGYGMHINTYNTNGAIYALELHNSSKHLFQVLNDGTTKFGGNAQPYSNNSYDLGTTSMRWRNVYTQDLQLSNEAKKDEGGNDVDGTWGDWTLQEGESDVYMINNRSGKKFRIKMEEVS